MSSNSQYTDSRVSRSGGNDLRAFMYNIRANRDTWASYQPSRHSRHQSVHSIVGKSLSKRQQIKHRVTRAMKTTSRKLRAYRQQSKRSSSSHSASRLPPTPLTASQMHHDISRYLQSSGRTPQSGFFSPTLRDRLDAVNGIPDDASSFLGHASTPEVQRTSPSGKRLTIHEASGPSVPIPQDRRNARLRHPVVSAVIAHPRPISPGSSPSVSSLDSWEIHDEIRFSSASDTSALTEDSADVESGLEHSGSLKKTVQQVFRKSLSGREALNTIDGLKNLPRPTAQYRPNVVSSTTRSSQALPYIAASGALLPRGTFDSSSDTDSDSDSVIQHNRQAALAALETKFMKPAPTAAPLAGPAHRVGRPSSTGGLFLPEKLDPRSLPNPKPLPKQPAPTGGLYLAYMDKVPFNPFNERLNTPPPPPPKPAPASPASTGPSTPDFADAEKHRKHYSKVEFTGSFLLDDSSEEETLPASSRSATPDFEASNERHSRHYKHVESGVWELDEDDLYSSSRPVSPALESTTVDFSIPLRPETPGFDRNDMAHEMQYGRMPSAIIDDRDTLPSQLKKLQVSDTADPSTRFSGMDFLAAPDCDSAKLKPSGPKSKGKEAPLLQLPAQHSAALNPPVRFSAMALAPPQLADHEVKPAPPGGKPARPQQQIKRKPVPTHPASLTPASKPTATPIAAEKPLPPVPASDRFNENGYPILSPSSARTQHTANPTYQPRSVNYVEKKLNRDVAKEEAKQRSAQKEGKWAGFLKKAAANYV